MSLGKKCFNLISLGAVGYCAYKAYRYITGIINISRELPVYIKNVIGESPSMNINMVFNRMTITLSFSPDTIKEHPEIAETALEYVSRYYPIFRPDHVNIEVFEKQVAPEPVKPEVTPEPEEKDEEKE